MEQETKREEIQQDNQQLEQQPVQEVKKQRDPNDRKIILCLIAIFFLIVGPVVLTKIFKEINRQKYENEIKMNNAFRGTVANALNRNGIKDKISNIQLVTYTDNYPENFSLNICAYSDTKVYYYELDTFTYPENKDMYNNFIGCLLHGSYFAFINDYGSYTLSTYDRVKEDVNTEYKHTEYVVGKNASNEQYLFGYYVKDKNYNVFSKIQVVEGTDPFSGESTLITKDNSLLYKYYKYISL